MKFTYTMYTTVQRQTAVTAYFSSKQLLLFVFVRQYDMSKEHTWRAISSGGGGGG